MSSLKHWRNTELGKIKTDMDKLFNALCTDFGLPPLLSGRGLTCPCQFERTNGELVVRTKLENISIDELELTVEEQTLLITGVQREESQGMIGTKSFSSRITLPVRVKPDQAKAAYKDGILEIRLPIEDQPREQRIRIQAG